MQTQQEYRWYQLGDKLVANVSGKKAVVQEMRVDTVLGLTLITLKFEDGFSSHYTARELDKSFTRI